MADPNARQADMQSLMESILSRLPGDPANKPVGLVTISPAHFPPIAVNETVLSPVLGDLVAHILAHTLRQEIRIESKIVPTESLPVTLQHLESGSRIDREGPWALISISDEHAPRLSRQHEAKYEIPTSDQLEEFFVEAEPIISKQGGKLIRGSIGPEGIQVWIALPLHLKAMEEADVTRVRESIETRLERSDEGSLKLLVHAESDELRAMLSENLVEGGYYVIAVSSIGEVLPYARRELPDMIILDLQSREPSAMDIALMLRGEPDFSRIPILFLTEIGGPGIGRRMDTVDFLIQPEGAHAILQTVDQVLRTGVRPTGRIMVVEQDDLLREEMLGTIQAQGHPVVEARSAEEALALAERVRIGIVLASVELAEARDYWLVRQLRQLPDELQIYLMTEGAQSVDKASGLRRGISGYGDTGRLRELLARVEDDENGEEGG